MVFKKNHVPWNKGLKANEDERVKRACDATHKAHLGKSPWNKNKKLSQAHIQKLKDSHKGIHSFPKTEFKKGDSPWNLGLSPNDDTKRKISESVKAKNIKGINHPFYGKHHTIESNEKNRVAHLGKKTSIETKEKQRRKSIQNWQNPEYARKVLKGEHKFPNKPEKELNILLQQILSNEYKYVGDGQVIIQGKCPDFINVNGQKKIIEMFGEYFHPKDDESNRKFIFNLFGYQTLVVWQEELKDIDTLTSKLLEFNRK